MAVDTRKFQEYETIYDLSRLRV